MTTRILTGDCRALLADIDLVQAGSVQTCVTSPPYFGLRDYGHAGQIGLEPTPDAYVAELVAVFREVRRVLRADGTLWLNLGDSYASTAPGTRNGSGTGLQTNPGRISQRGDWRLSDWPIKAKDLFGIPWRVAFALQADGWYLRSDIIWSKPNPMPESVTDRPTKAHEYVFLLSKSERYAYDADAIAEPSLTSDPRRPYTSEGAKALDGRSAWQSGERRAGDDFTTRNARSVWQIATAPYGGAHFATMPPALAERCILAGSKPGDTVLDPFGGAGTTGLVADRLGRDAILCELNPAYAALAADRVRGDSPLFAEVSA